MKNIKMGRLKVLVGSVSTCFSSGRRNMDRPFSSLYIIQFLLPCSNFCKIWILSGLECRICCRKMETCLSRMSILSQMRLKISFYIEFDKANLFLSLFSGCIL